MIKSNRSADPLPSNPSDHHTEDPLPREMERSTLSSVDMTLDDGPRRVAMEASGSSVHVETPGAGRHAALPALVAAMIGIGIFIFDTFSPLHFAVAVLYVIVILIVATYHQRQGVLFAAAACGALTVLSYALSHGFDLHDTAPVRSIISLAAIGITTFLALKNLAASARLRGAERARANLVRFFSPQLIDELVDLDTPFSIARYQPATVLFVDMVGFTSYCSGMAPAAVIEIMRDLLSLLSESVFTHNGIIDKFLGDGLMAVFGPPIASSHDATNAALCALDILHKIDLWNDRCHRTGDAAIRVAIGIHYGDVVQGDVGSDKRLELTVIGDTVNIASRVEAYCRSLDTAVLVTDAFISSLHMEGSHTIAAGFVDQGHHLLRGRAEQIRLYGVKRSASS
jgi:class 3 adenylate cyclase